MWRSKSFFSVSLPLSQSQILEDLFKACDECGSSVHHHKCHIACVHLHGCLLVLKLIVAKSKNLPRKSFCVNARGIPPRPHNRPSPGLGGMGRGEGEGNGEGGEGRGTPVLVRRQGREGRGGTGMERVGRDGYPCTALWYPFSSPPPWTKKTKWKHYLASYFVRGW